MLDVGREKDKLPIMGSRDDLIARSTPNAILFLQN
jgi:hypothetical protein